MDKRKLRASSGLIGARSVFAALSLCLLFALAAETPVAAQPVDRPAIAGLAEDLLDAVVSVTASYRFEIRDEALLPDQNLGEAIPEFQGIGSGFVIDSSGIIVTNNHVVEDADDIIVAFQDGSELRATIIGRDFATDIAVLRVHPPRPLASVSFGSSEVVAVGDWVMAIGNPFGFGGTVTMGVLSARGRDLYEGPYDNFLQTDAAINQGSSGGPLFDLNGNVIGINTAIISTSGEAMGVAFSIPSEIASRVVDHLIAFGEVRRGWLGVRIQEVTPGIAEGFNLELARGALVAEVIADSPAAAAGLLTGDIIVGFDDIAIDEMRDLPRTVAATDVGREVEIIVIRSDAEITRSVTIAALEQTNAAAIVTPVDPAANLPETITAAELGLEVSPIRPELRAEHGVISSVKGLLITGIAARSLAAERPVIETDIIVAVAGSLGAAPFSTVAQLDAALANALAESHSVVVLLLARPSGETRFEWIRLGG